MAWCYLHQAEKEIFLVFSTPPILSVTMGKAMLTLEPRMRRALLLVQVSEKAVPPDNQARTVKTLAMY
jgi:hypothetical protein